MVKMLTAKEAVETYFYSGATVTFGGFANGLMHPEAIMAARAGRTGRTPPGSESGVCLRAG